MPLRIDVGAGKEPKSGYIPIDYYYTAPGYIKAQCWDLPYKNGEVNEVWCCHTLEHVEKRKVLPTLQEFYRVLCVGGLVTIEVPDLTYIMKTWLQHRTDDWFLDTVFGNQDDPGQFHMTGFTVDILCKDLVQAKFSILRTETIWSHEQDTIHVEAKK